MKATGVDPCKVKYYDIGEETLSIRSIGTVYGINNFYKDARNLQNVNEIEEKLANLEGIAANILQRLHVSANASEEAFTLTRDETEKLRKFLFVMNYRNKKTSLLSFDPNDPANASSRRRLERMQTTLGLHTPTDMWLHFMRYYLDTPHSQLLRDAAQSMEDAKRTPMFDDLAPDLELFEAVAYQIQAGRYHLGFWEAAPGEEFVLSDNSFGLWEGQALFSLELHILFIISPQIAIVLRLNSLRPEVGGREFRRSCQSNFMDIPLPSPRPVYVNGRSELRATPRRKYSHSNEILHTLSQYNPRDTFEFALTTLTKDQTFTVNSVVLLNASSSLTYLSAKRMRETAQRYNADVRNTLPRGRRTYQSLVRHIEEAAIDPHFPNSILLSRSRGAYTKSTSDSLHPLLRESLLQIPADGATRYEIANRIYHIIRNGSNNEKAGPFIEEYTLRMQEAIERFFSTDFSTPDPKFQPSPNAELVRTCGIRGNMFFGAFSTFEEHFHFFSREQERREEYNLKQQSWAGWISDWRPFSWIKQLYSYWGEEIDQREVYFAKYFPRSEREDIVRRWDKTMEDTLVIGLASLWVKTRRDVFDDMMAMFEPLFNINMDFVES